MIADFAQAIGFARWPFVVDSPANRYVGQPVVILAIFDIVHRTVGVAIGEHLFFCFESLWALATGVHLQRALRGLETLVLAVFGGFSLWLSSQFTACLGVFVGLPLSPRHVFASV